MSRYPSEDEDDLVPSLQWLEDAINMLLRAAYGLVAGLFGHKPDRE